MLVKTLQQAKRLIKIVVGFTLLLIGMVMWFTPGPGWGAIIAGLALLAAEFVWARRLLNRLKLEGTKLRDVLLPQGSRGRRVFDRIVSWILRIRDAIWSPNQAKPSGPQGS